MFVHHCKPSKAYNRLLSALGLLQTPTNDQTYFNELMALLDVRMSQLSDCIRRGCVTDPVLDAARARGINPEFITHSKDPMYLDNLLTKQ